MVGRIETNGERATGVVYHRDGRWRFQRARNVVAAGYSIETPRLLLNSATARFPHGLANANGLVGKYLMVHANHAVFGEMEESIRWYKGPPSMAVCEHWNDDDDKDFDGGYAFMSQGPLPVDFAQSFAANTGIWGTELRRRMARYNHMAGLKIVGETMPQEKNRVELADATDRFGLPIAKVTFGYCDNDKRLYGHSLRYMRRMLEAAGASDLFETESTAHLMGGCAIGRTPNEGVTDPDGRTWDIDNLWVCDGSLFPTAGGVNPSLTIFAMAERIAERIVALAGRGELERRGRFQVA